METFDEAILKIKNKKVCRSSEDNQPKISVSL